MESVLRGAATYGFVWLIFRIAGKRSLAQITTFDAVLLLIISETTQAALSINDNSLTNSCLLILTLMGIDLLLSHLKRRSHMVERLIDGVPRVLLDHRGLDETALREERIEASDILSAARQNRGVANFDEIEYAVLEQHGGISVIPKRG